ncbi:MAG: hypothetical protein ACREMJ_09840, partial [Gemmatimonadales bacterium]
MIARLVSAVLVLAAPACGPAQAPAPKPAPAPQRWLPLIGEYGRPGDTAFVYEAGGVLYWEPAGSPANRLAETAETVFVLVPGKEALVFRTDPRGRVRAAEVAGTAYPRRPLGPENGNQL